jgi:hypothetical protein
MDTPFDTVTILPSYLNGFTFLWTISPGFADKFPWKFHVELGHTDAGPWEDISGELENVYAWVEPTRRRIQATKDPHLFFRITLTTPSGAYESQIKTPYGDLCRREYLIVQEIMRQVHLEQQHIAGVPAKLWSKAAWGSPCTVCRDPISGSVTDSDCAECFGTGRQPAYHGPYEVYATFSPQKRDKQQKKGGPTQLYTRSIRMVGFPAMKDDDILVDAADDKRYIVDGVAHQMEIRKVPVVQHATAHLLPTSDAAYRLGVE